jgi:hypothetical protein
MSDFLPDEVTKLWLYKYAKKTLWQVAEWMDFDDFVQEGFLAYVETRRRYPDAIEPKHIMALFQLVLRSHIEDIKRIRAKQLDASSFDRLELWPDGSGAEEVLIPDTFDLYNLLAKAPQTIKEVLNLFVDDNARAKLAEPYDGRRGKLNDRFCRLLGKNPKEINLEQELKAYFS